MDDLDKELSASEKRWKDYVKYREMMVGIVRGYQGDLTQYNKLVNEIPIDRRLGGRKECVEHFEYDLTEIIDYLNPHVESDRWLTGEDIFELEDLELVTDMPIDDILEKMVELRMLDCRKRGTGVRTYRLNSLFRTYVLQEKGDRRRTTHGWDDSREKKVHRGER